MRYRIIIISGLVWALSLLAQDAPVNTLIVERETTRHTLSGNWDEVIDVGKKALARGIDFYNLRYRMGIAYYYKKNYHGAIRHFNKAYQVNAKDPLLNEYLYWAYRYAGYSGDARVLAAGLSQELRKKARIPDKPSGDYLSLSFNAGFPVDKTFTDTYVNSTGLAVNGAQFLSKTLAYADFGIHKIFSSRLSVHAAYARLNKTSYLYAQENGYSVTKPNYETHLNQVYLSSICHVMQGTDLAAGAHMINIRYQRDRYIIEGLEGRIVTDDISKYEGLVFLSLNHRFPYLTTSISSVFSTLNHKEQMQADFQVTAYPLGNLNLYGGLFISFHHQRPDENKVILEYLLGGKIVKNIWIETFLTTGDLQNVSRYQGYVVYNGLDAIKQRYGGRCIITLTNELSVSLDYAFQKHESLFIPENTALSPVNPFEYTSHSMTGALRWNF